MGELGNEYSDRFDPDATRKHFGFPDPFERGITFADRDAHEEAGGGWGLVIEFKRTGQTVGFGQYHTLYEAARTGDTALVVWGEPHYVQTVSGSWAMLVTGMVQLDPWNYYNVEPLSLCQSATNADFFQRCADWFKCVEEYRAAHGPRPDLKSPFPVPYIASRIPPPPVLTHGLS